MNKRRPWMKPELITYNRISNMPRDYTHFTIKMVADAWYNGDESAARHGLNDAGANPQLDVFKTDPAEVISNEVVKKLFWMLSKKDGQAMNKQSNQIPPGLVKRKVLENLIDQQNDVQAMLEALEALGQACSHLAEIIKKAAGIDK